MPGEVLTVPAAKLAEAKARILARGGVIVKEEKLNGNYKLTVDYPPV